MNGETTKVDTAYRRDPLRGVSLPGSAVGGAFSLPVVVSARRLASPADLSSSLLLCTQRFPPPGSKRRRH